MMFTHMVNFMNCMQNRMSFMILMKEMELMKLIKT